MSQNQLIALLTLILALVIVGSIVVLLSTSDKTGLPAELEGLPAAVEAPAGSPSSQRLFPLELIERQAYQLLNKQLVKGGALPVLPPAGAGKANPFI